MRCVIRSPFVYASCSAVALLGMVASNARAIDMSAAVNEPGVVGDLAVMVDLEPLAEIAAMQRDQLVAAPTLGQPIGQADTHLRSSVPSAARARTLFGGGEVFANSATVLPLLVVDLEPAASPVSRPLSGGRLVGARPSLPLNRVPLTRLPLATRSAQ